MRRMRGDHHEPDSMFSYVSPEQRIPNDHPLRAIRAPVNEVLADMSREFDRLYATMGRPSIPPERLLRAQLPRGSSRRMLTVCGRHLSSRSAVPRRARVARTNLRQTSIVGAPNCRAVCDCAAMREALREKGRLELPEAFTERQ